MTPKEIDARSCLANGGYLIDPRYANDKQRAGEALKKRVKECWQFREGFPQWVGSYIERWAAEKVKRSPDEVSDLETVGRDDARSA